MTSTNDDVKGQKLPTAVEVRIAAEAAEAEAASLPQGSPEWRAAFTRSLELWRLVREVEQTEAERAR